MRVSKMTSQRTRPLNVARSHSLQNVISEYVRDTFLFKLCEGSVQNLILKYVRFVIFQQVGGNTMMKL